MKVLVAVSSQDYFQSVLKFLNSDLNMTFALENLLEDGNISYNQKNYKVLSVNSLNNFLIGENYDRILIFASKNSNFKMALLRFGVDESKILDLSFVIENDFIKKSFLLQQFENKIADFKILILGNETAANGLDLNQFNLPAVNFASRHQDLYFDFLYLKKILSNPQNKIKYVLFGIAPYSFRFDLSQSQYKNFALTYYPIFKNNHNFKIADAELQKIFNLHFLQSYDDKNFLDNIQQNFEIDFNDPFGFRKENDRGINLIDLFGVRAQVKKHCKNPDAKIFAENVKIFTDCIELCKKNSVTPIVTIFPAEKNYRQYFSEKIFCEFKSTLLDLQEKYQFKILDYWQLDEFNGKDFFKFDEFNLSGAKKFTPYISNYIDKLESKKIRLAFTMQVVNSWSKIIPLYKKMVESQKFDLYGLITPSDSEEAKKLHTGELITCEYGEQKIYYHDLYDDDKNITLIDVVQNNDWIDLQKYHFDYVFYLRPYDYAFRTPLKCQTVSKFAKTFHILYGILTTDNFINFYLGFHDFYNAVNFYFTECQNLAEVFNAYYKAVDIDGEQNFIFRGIPEIENEIELNEKNFYINLDKPRKSILWTPRWNYWANIGGSHFLEYKDDFVNLRKKYPDLQMIARPHPSLWNYLKDNKVMTENEIKKHKNFLKKNKILLDETPTYVEAINESDIMITDVTSIMINFFLTGKPMIYCPPTYNLYGDCKDMERGLYIANNWQEVEKYLAMLLSGEDPLKDERRKVFELLRERHKNACANIMQTLIDDYNSQAIKF